MLKLVGCILVLFSSAGLGVAGAWDLRRHCTELWGLKQTIHMLKGEIRYTKAPLPEVFHALGKRAVAPFSQFFGNLSEELKHNQGQSLQMLWGQEMRRSLASSTLKREEKRKFQQLGDGLGYLNLEMQLSTLELYLEQLEEDLLRAQEEMHTKQKLYQSLGIAGGVFLVILLV